MASYYLCRVDEVPEGEARGFDPRREGADSMFVVRKEGRLHAWRDACPHYGNTSMAWRKDAYLDAAGERIVCSAHGAQFAIASGVCTLGPCLGQSLIPVPLRMGEACDIYAELEELKGTT
jgi:nitrite reductase/ring-hydroxylating ferredoxin subunit